MCQYVGEAAESPQGNADEIVNYKLGMKDKAELIRKGLVSSFLKVPGYREANYLQEEAEKSRLKIPLLIATDAIHGHGMDIEAATIFLSPIGIAATFDTSIAEKIAQYTAREMRATGFHWSFSPNVDVVRDARWGRTGETFGEDPLLVTALGIAMVKGYQGKEISTQSVLSCAKHLVAGGIPYNGLNGAPTDISERTLHEIFYPPFKKAVEQGVCSIMPAHNEVNGIPCHADHEMLTGLLRKKWGFEGIIISDWNDIARLHTTHRIAETRKDADKTAVLAGLDMHMHGGEFLENIKALVQEGKVTEERINESVKRILRVKFRLGLFENRYIKEEEIRNVVLSNEHKALALEAARKSIVLLKNEKNILPLSIEGKSIFITGPNVNDQSLLGDWSRLQPDENVITVLEGLHNIASSNRMDYFDCGGILKISDAAIREASARAKRSDIAIIVAGENSIRTNPDKTSGENLDRSDLELQGRQLELIKSIKQSGKPVILVLINGAPIASEWCAENVDAIIEAWEPGAMGGQAIADVIFGKFNPSGKLPVTIPRSAGHIQSFYNYKPSAFHRGKFSGMSTQPLYEFGFGLSYTSFHYSNLKMRDTILSNEKLEISVDIENTEDVSGEESVLIFITDLYSSVTTPVKQLKAFTKIFLNTGEKKTITFLIEPHQLSLLDRKLNRRIEPGEFEIIAGSGKLKRNFYLKE
jgi:beta-glucosidase